MHQYEIEEIILLCVHGPRPRYTLHILESRVESFACAEYAHYLETAQMRTKQKTERFTIEPVRNAVNIIVILQFI